MELNGIDAALKSKGITRQQLAEYCNVTLSGMGKYIRGEREAPYELLVKICLYLDLSVDYVLGLNVDMKYVPDDEAILIQRYRQLSDDGKELLRADALKLQKDYPICKQREAM